MISYIHHINIHTAYCANNVLSDYPPEWKIYYTLHRKRDICNVCCVCLSTLNDLLHSPLHMDNLTMYMLMFLRDTSLAECFITRRNMDTLQMYKFTSLQNTVLPEALVANITWIWPIPTTYVMVLLESTLLSEWFITHITRTQMLPNAVA